MKARHLYLLVILVITAILFFFNQPANRDNVPNDNKGVNRSKKSVPPSDVQNRNEPLNRKTSKLIYTRHARCRMKCRHIDETEVKEILEKGRVNYEKSEPAARPDPKFAVEGRTRDQQQVRIVFAQADRGLVVVTVIDLEKEWRCNCK